MFTPPNRSINSKKKQKRGGVRVAKFDFDHKKFAKFEFSTNGPVSRLNTTNFLVNLSIKPFVFTWSCVILVQSLYVAATLTSETKKSLNSIAEK